MSCSALNETIRVLIVEDNLVDLYFIQEALNSEYTIAARTVDDGGPALTMLQQRSPYENEPQPDLVILDLNLKQVDGREVLSYIRATPTLQETAVAIVSSSPADFAHADSLGADCYIQKPSGMEAFLGIGKRIWECYREKKSRR